MAELSQQPNPSDRLSSGIAALACRAKYPDHGSRQTSDARSASTKRNGRTFRCDEQPPTAGGFHRTAADQQATGSSPGWPECCSGTGEFAGSSPSM